MIDNQNLKINFFYKVLEKQRLARENWLYNYINDARFVYESLRAESN
jgi:hypothetical protein